MEDSVFHMLQRIPVTYNRNCFLSSMNFANTGSRLFLAQQQLLTTFSSCVFLRLNFSKPVMYGHLLPPCSDGDVENTLGNLRDTTVPGKHVRWRSSRLFHMLLPMALCETQNRSKSTSDAATKDMDDSKSEAVVEDSLPGVQMKRKPKGLDQLGHTMSVSSMEINQWIEAESGVDRLKHAYTLGSDAKFVNEDTTALTTMWYRTVLLAFFVNVFTASQKQQKREKHLSRTDGAMKAAMREKTEPIKVFREAFRSTLRMSLSAATVFHLPHIIATYRNETTIWEFALSAGLACGMLGRGWRGALTMTLSGTIFGIVGGYMITGFLMQHGLSQEQRHLDRVKQLILNQRNSSTKSDSQVS